MSLLVAYSNRGITRDIVIKNSAGGIITPGANDRVIVTITRLGVDKLVVDSSASTANGSSITKGAANRLRLDASDLMFTPGAYEMRVDLLDVADSNELKNVDREVFYLEQTP